MIHTVQYTTFQHMYTAHSCCGRVNLASRLRRDMAMSEITCLLYSLYLSVFEYAIR